MLHDPGIVYQYIKLAIAILDALRERKHILTNGDVAAQSHDPGILILELLERDLVTPTNDHCGAPSRESFDKRPAYPGVAASHYDDAVAPRSALRMRGRH